MADGLQSDFSILIETILRELMRAGNVEPGQIVVIGCSTSEVQGERIGTSGTEAIAREIYKGVEKVKREAGFHLAFQCCEHLNRALVVDKSLLKLYSLEQVSVVPVPTAGGSMASYAYGQMGAQACVVETIQAHAGIDIGDTLIGMHLRRVAVPVRPSILYIGQARVTMAYTRPKLIGGVRAVYMQESIAKADACL